MIVLSGRIQIIKKIKPTTSQIFKDVQEGDILDLVVPIKPAARGYHSGLHATYIRVTNMTTGEYCKLSFTELSSRLANFEMQQLH